MTCLAILALALVAYFAIGSLGSASKRAAEAEDDARFLRELDRGRRVRNARFRRVA